MTVALPPSETGFDAEIDRRVVPALKHSQLVLGTDGMDLFPAGIAHMDFRVAACISEAIAEPEGTFLLWLDFRELGLSPDEVTRFLRSKAGWSLTRGIAFGPQGAGFGRLNIACQQSRLSTALDKA